jgi:hypothetical protein
MRRWTLGLLTVAFCLTASAAGRAEDMFRKGSEWAGMVTWSWVDKGKTEQRSADCELVVSERDGLTFEGELSIKNGERRADIKGTIDDEGNVLFTLTKVEGPNWPKDAVKNFQATGRLKEKVLTWNATFAGTTAKGNAKLQLKSLTHDPFKGIKDPRLLQIVSDMRAYFNYIDEDKDEHLDDEELARAFRGPDAKPYRPMELTTSPGAKSEVDRDGGVKAVKGSDAPVRLTPAQLKKKYPDYDFLMHWDIDRDGKISRAEFMEFANIVVSHFRTMFQKLDEIEKFQKELTKEGLKGAQRNQLRAQMMVLRTELANSRDGFRHNLYLDSMYRGAELNRFDWAWYKLVNKVIR